MILIAYDGSADGRAAVEHAATLFAGDEATVLTAWSPVMQIVAGDGIGIAAYPPPDSTELDRVSKEAAEATAQQGAALAEEHGLRASARAVVRETSTADAIMAAADEVDAGSIVLGTRGRGGLRSLLLGSVSRTVLEHADRPVVVVPSDAVADERGARRRRHDHHGIKAG